MIDEENRDEDEDEVEEDDGEVDRVHRLSASERRTATFELDSEAHAAHTARCPLAEG